MLGLSMLVGFGEDNGITCNDKYIWEEINVLFSRSRLFCSIFFICEDNYDKDIQLMRINITNFRIQSWYEEKIVFLEQNFRIQD
jgi:hypothetical protein